MLLIWSSISFTAKICPPFHILAAPIVKSPMPIAYREDFSEDMRDEKSA